MFKTVMNAAALVGSFFSMGSPLGRFSYEPEAILKRIQRRPSNPPTRQVGRPWNARSNARRLRQGAHLHQHPSVVARFAAHPTRAQIEETIRVVG